MTAERLARRPSDEVTREATGVSRAVGSRGGVLTWAAAVTLIALVTAFTYRRQVFEGWSFPWDFQGGASNSPAFIGATQGGGHLTEWNPFIGGGSPLPLDIHTGYYLPVWGLLKMLHVTATLRVVTDFQVAHVWFGGVGILALGQARGMRVRYSLIAALAFVFFGGFFTNAEHAEYFRGHAYAPWILWSLTLPRDPTRRWWRLLALPAAAWLLTSEGYPGQIVSFGIIATVYLGLELRQGRRVSLSRSALPLALAIVSALAVAGLILLPFEKANASGQLFRAYVPTVDVRAAEALHPVDLFGLYLNGFAWAGDDMTIRGWALGVPVIIGLAGLRRRVVWQHLSLAVAGGVALLLAAAPTWDPVGRLMLRVPVLFPSRFPAADYKAMVAVALVLLAAEGWRILLGEPDRVAWVAPALCGLVVLGTFAMTSTLAADPTRRPAVVVAVALVATAIAVAPRLRNPRVATAAVLLVGGLVIVDGLRMSGDWISQTGASPWATPPQMIPDLGLRTAAAHALPAVLANPPARRPARVPPVVPFAREPTGTNNDTLGFLGLGYGLSDYSPTITEARHRVDTDPELQQVMLEPWNAWTWPCSAVDCGAAAVQVPVPVRRAPDPRIQTTRYDLGSIAYRVDIDQPVLMVENEMGLPGWNADRSDVHVVLVDGALRGWVLPAGTYALTTTYRLPERTAQEALAAVALVSWLACLAVLVGLPRAPVSRGRLAHRGRGARSSER